MDCPSTPEERIKVWRDYAMLCRQTAEVLALETYNQDTWLSGFIRPDRVLRSTELPVAKQISACGSAACLAGTMTFIHPEAREELMFAITTGDLGGGQYGWIVQRNIDLFTPGGNVMPWLYSGNPAESWPTPFDQQWLDADLMPFPDLDGRGTPGHRAQRVLLEERAQMKVDIAKAMLTKLADVIEDQCNNATDVVTCDWYEEDSDCDQANDPWQDLHDIINSHA